MQPFRGNAVITFDIETKGALVVERTDEFHPSISRWMEKNAPFIAQVAPMEDSLTTDPVQIMFCGGVEQMRRALDALERAEMGDEITVLKTEYVARDLCIIDVLNRNCSKGHAVERWARHRGIAREQVMAIGDNYNDIEMLEFAGLPVIMGNASEELKQRGWTVTLSNDESGVAAAIDQVLGARVGA
jgi:hydroxymethylpyrimidine pyrophosphatase-like HAD family hydrolase